MQQPVHDNAGGAVFHRLPVGGLKLPQNLGLPHDQGIQAGRHPEQVLNRFIAPVGIDIGFQTRLGPPGWIFPGSDDLLEGPVEVFGGQEDLDPVAGGQGQGLFNDRRSTLFPHTHCALNAGRGKLLRSSTGAVL